MGIKINLLYEIDWKRLDARYIWSCKIRIISKSIFFIKIFQVNHFRNSRELCRKDLLNANIKKIKRKLESQKKYDEIEKYDFIPIGYELPREYNLLVEKFKEDPKCTWIMKPVGDSQGHGIFLFDKLSDINKWNSDKHV